MVRNNLLPVSDQKDLKMKLDVWWFSRQKSRSVDNKPASNMVIVNSALDSKTEEAIISISTHGTVNGVVFCLDVLDFSCGASECHLQGTNALGDRAIEGTERRMINQSYGTTKANTQNKELLGKCAVDTHPPFQFESGRSTGEAGSMQRQGFVRI